MKQMTYPGVEVKRHPGATSAMAALGHADALACCPTDVELASDIVEVYEAIRRLHSLSAASGEWRWIFENSRREYQSALEQNQPERLAALLRNFFRNDLSFGLVSHGTFEKLEKGTEDDLLEFSNVMLLDLDTWLELCDSPDVSSLAIPHVGNPYGIVVEGTLVTPDVCRHSYHARKLREFMDLSSDRPTVLEIGGGYGGVFWRLWSDFKQDKSFCYINCDLEQSLFLFYYFVLACSRLSHRTPPGEPNVKWAIDGVVTEADTRMYDLILVPARRHAFIDCGVDIAYNANSFSEMAGADVDSYFQTISRNNPNFIFHQNSNFFPWKESSREHIEVLARDFPIDRSVFSELHRSISPWMGANGRYREYLYVQKGMIPSCRLP